MANRQQFEPGEWLRKLGWEQTDVYAGPEDERPIGGPWHFRKRASPSVVSEATVYPDGSVAVRCPKCRIESFNREDLRHQFCIKCGWHNDFSNRGDKT